MRRKDYPKGDSDGVKRATKEAILKILNNKNVRNKIQLRAMILFLKDTGLRISDARRLNCDFFLEALEKNPNTDIIEIHIITQKTKLLAKAFLGEEAIEALKEYLQLRETGSTDKRNVPPETITKDSPLFKTWKGGKIKRILRTSFSSQIAAAFNAVKEKRMSAHSLRKKLQTDLERAKINANWIDQILGHKLINSRDAYSLPTDEELKDAYKEAYKFIKVYPEINMTPIQDTRKEATQKPQTTPQNTTLTAEQIIQLLKPEQVIQLIEKLRTNS
jgi:integrase